MFHVKHCSKLLETIDFRRKTSKMKCKRRKKCEIYMFHVKYFTKKSRKYVTQRRFCKIQGISKERTGVSLRALYVRLTI